jgi:hypothetical protein
MAASQGCAEPLIPQPCGAWHSPAFKRYDRITTKSELGARAAIFIAVDHKQELQRSSEKNQFASESSHHAAGCSVNPDFIT